MIRRGNPFRIHGVVTDQFFTNRAAELSRIETTLAQPGAKLMVYGRRRMGKTSALAQAIARHQKTGGAAFLADLSTASTLVDVANRILESSTRVLGRRWKDVVNDFVARMGVTMTLTPDPTTGAILPSLDWSLRAAPLEQQRKSLAATLDAIEALAVARKTNIGVVLDEFQEIRRFGGDSAEWQLRGVIQHHRHVSYVLAGSEAHLIQGMLAKGRAFFGMADPLEFGPMDPDHLGHWIDGRMTRAGVKTKDAGARAVLLAGPRTRDAVQVARQCFDNTRSAGKASGSDVDAAFEDVVAEQEALLQSTWNELTALQQNVLRAVAAGRSGLTTRESLSRFALGESGTASNTAAALIDDGHLLRTEGATGYGFDSPFFRHWVIHRTLGDIGLPPRSGDA